MLRIFVVFALLCLGFSEDEFTCQGGAYKQASETCPDFAAQRLTTGGNVNVLVKSIKNLPDRDVMGASSVSDPYVEFTVGANVKHRTKSVKDDLSPRWNEMVTLGVLGSATEILIKIWDHDVGLEGGDDLLVAASMRVPFCSTFNSTVVEATCKKPFNCRSTDSMWTMPRRQVCHESGELNMKPSIPCTDKGSMCLQLEFFIVPFQINLDVAKAGMLQAPPFVSSIGALVARAPWTRAYRFGAIYQDTIDVFETRAINEFDRLKGALYFQLSEIDRVAGRHNEVLFYASVNFPAYLYICRDVRDNARGVPRWLNQDFSAKNLTTSKLKIRDVDVIFECFMKAVPGTKKNKWGGIMSGAMAFRSNTVKGHDNGVIDADYYDNNYIVAFLPRVAAPREEDLSIYYDSGGFITSIFEHGIAWGIFAWLAVAFLKRVNYRVDRVMTYLVSQVYTGENKGVVATLFIACENQSPSNIEFRSHLCHAKNVVYFILSIPFFLLIAWGFSCVATIAPTALGYGIVFLGCGGQFLWYGFKLWESREWHMSPYALLAQIFSILLFFCFIISVIFADPAVFKYGHAINLAALSVVFGCLNLLPHFLLVFHRDKAYKVNLNVVIEKMTDTVFKIKKDKGEAPGKKSKKPLPINKVLHALLGDAYTLNPNVPLFRYGTILMDSTSAKTAAERDKTASKLVGVANAILFVYLMIGIARTDFPSICFLHCCALILLDSVHTSISHGDVKWSSGYHIFLLVAGRLFVTTSTSNYWIIHYSCAYLVYSIALSQEIINSFLPALSKHQAGEAAFAGKATDEKANPDVAGSPLFCLGTLSFAFVGLLMIVTFGKPEELPVTRIEVFGDLWSTYVFGLMAFLAVIVGSLLTATVRAFYLQKHGLLRGFARDGYIFRPQFRIPLLLAFFTEIAIISSGILLYGATGSSAMLTISIFLPPIVLCFGHSYKTWVEHDFELVVWPPVEVTTEHVDDTPSDLEVAFHMMDNIFGDAQNADDMQLEEFPETDDKKPPVEKTLKGFALPSMEAGTGTGEGANIKMPALPLKSALRKKRQNMGVATTGTPLVDDLRAREGANADSFGTGNILDADDPWAQFEPDEEDEEGDDALELAQQMNKKKKEKGSGNRTGLFDSETYLRLKAAWLGNPVGAYIAKQYVACIKFIKSRMQKYQKVGSGDEDDNKKDLDEVEGFEVPKDTDSLAELEDTEETPIVPPKVSDMDFWSAAASGYLTRAEYIVLATWFGGMFLLMIFGIVISKTINPMWVGMILWVASWMLILTAVPIVKYFNTYVVDDTMKQLAGFAALFHTIFCLSFFIAHLDADDDVTPSLWVLDYFLYYPMFVYLFIEAYRWRDENWRLEKLDKDGDGDITWQEYVIYFQAYPVIFVGLVLLTFQMYVWVGTIMGNVALLMLLVSIVGYIFARDWSMNDFFLSQRLTFYGDMMLKFILVITFLVSIFYPDNPAFPVSVFFFTLLFRCCTKIGTRLIVMEPDTVIFLSPFVMPVYSYDSRNNDVVNEADLAKQVAGGLFAGAMWGTAMAIFLYPVSVGVSVACVFLMIIAAIIAFAVSYVPLQLGNLVAMMSPDTMTNAVNAALETFEDRHKPLETEMVGWESSSSPRDYDDDEESTDKAKTKKSRTAIAVASELINDTRAMQFVRDDKHAKIVNIDDEYEEEIPWYQKYWSQFMDQYRIVRDAIFPPDINRGYKKHSESLLTFTDLIAEAILTGRGPFGFFGLEGTWYWLFKKAQNSAYLKFLRQPWLNVYDDYGNLTTNAQLAESFDTSAVLRRQVELDREIDGILHEEMRCGIHFLMMVIVAADAKLQREKILFQKFLRENRFRLASNGISPPPEVFTSSSYASIDIPLVAVWLSTLSQEERDRFHMLKNTFSEEQMIRDEAIDNEDYVKRLEASKLLKERSYRDMEMFHRITHEIQLRQSERVRAFVDHLSPQDKQVFLFNKDDWLNNADCFVNPKDVELYEKFKAAVMHDDDESTEYARQVLADVEAARRDCRIGEYGRSYQFVDPEFSPGDNSIGDCEALRQCSVWKCAPGISDAVQLFDEGTDPDDVEVGQFKTEWLLSAISMLAAAGGIGDGGVDEQVLNLFVGHYGIDGQISYHTEVGAYCVRLHKGGIWVPLVMDDLFPTLKEDLWTNENKGIASAHSKEVKELWVSLIEKAFAKYYGSYALIEKGYVHHALSDMTGCEGECLSMNSYARGPKKRALWDMMMRYRKNGYIVGAGTGSSALADKGIIEMGIVFDAAYTIYDVRQVDGHQLIKLRNPPGDHEEWKGDWSDESALWTRRLKKKLGWTNADDNTFWMAFDDFCNVFRDLYICKWYDKKKWHETTMTGAWQKIEELTSLKKMSSRALNMLLLEDEDFAASQKKAGANRPDTAGGLPSRHNPGCVLENNPFFSLQLDRPTDFRITLTQADSRGVAHGDPLPVAIYICKSPHPKVALRLKTLNRDDVVAYSGPAQAERTIHLYASLKPGLYVVLVGTYITGMESNFTLSLLSNYKTSFQQLWPPTWLGEGQAVNPDALLDGPVLDTQFESAFLKRIVDKVGTAFKELLGTGEKPVTRDDESEDEEEEEDLTAVHEAAKEYRKEHGMDVDDNV